MSCGTFKGIPHNSDWCIQDPVELYQSVKWHSDSFDRPIKNLCNKILQIDYSFE